MVELRNAGVLDYIRFVFSALILVFSATVTSYAIIETKTSFWKSVPGFVAIILFIIDLFILGIVEGLQIALVELKREHPESYRHSHPAAYRLGQVAARGDNVERFLMGRQVFVVFLVFFAAKLTTIKLEPGEGFLFPAPGWFQSVFLETGVLACVVVVIVAQLMPQIVAAKYPVHFLEFVIMRPAYYMCVFVEVTGLTHICWVLSGLLSTVFRMDKQAGFDKVRKGPEEGIKMIERRLSGALTAPRDGQEKVRKGPEEGIMMIEQRLSGALAAPRDCQEKEKGPEEGIERIDGALSGALAAPRDGQEKEKQDRMLNLAVTPKGQEEFAKFIKMVETMNNEIDGDTLKIVRHYLDQHPEKFFKFPTVIGGRMYPSPASLADSLAEAGEEVPLFLTPVNHPEHVPPHVVACELLKTNRKLRQELEELREKMGAHKNEAYIHTKM